MALLKSFLTAIIVGLGSVAHAEQTPLTAQDIEALLTDNTAIGAWSGTPYRQFFAADGTTYYKAEGAREERGRWPTNSETKQYESYWDRSGWSRFPVTSDGESYYWIELDGTAQAFTVEPGNTLRE